MNQSVYSLRDVTVDLGGRRVLGPVDYDLFPGSFVAIVGPNGSGKTTLLRTLTGAASPAKGEITLLERHLATYRPLEIARHVGVVPQTFTLDFSFTVEEMVAMGRYSHTTDGRHNGPSERALTSPGGRNDDEVVAHALETTGLSELAGRHITQLSGGERQRALIAQTLAQDTPILLLDEPLNNLDLNHQLDIMQMLRALHTEGRTIAIVLHDLNMAAQYCDELALLDHGLIVSKGAPEQVLDPRLILEVFKTRVSVHLQGRRPYVTPVWSEPAAKVSGGDGRRKVHVVAGGGSASGLIEELVMRGFAPSVGVVSVFDTDYATAQAYELEVVSAPPFEAFSTETMQELEGFVRQADAIIIAPMFFGQGNLAPLRSALQAAKTGTKVLIVDQPPLEGRDQSGGEATRLVADLIEAGAIEVSSPTEAVDGL